jgi:hypothetical protein
MYLDAFHGLALFTLLLLRVQGPLNISINRTAPNTTISLEFL